MNPKESNRLRDKIMEILQAHCTDNTGTDVRPLYPLIHFFEAELHEYGNNLKGKIIDLEFDIQKLNREILLLETKNEELKDDFLSEQEENTSLRSRLSDIEERAKEMGCRL